MKRLGLFLLVAMAFVPRLAQADGGIVRARETRGPFLITIFTPSEVFTAAPLEVSVMVQDRETNQVVMDAIVELSLAQPNESIRQSEIGGPGSAMTGHMMRGDSKTMHQPSIIRVTRGQGTNKLLYSTNVVLPLMGDWILHVSVRHDRGEATVRLRFACRHVTRASRRSLALPRPNSGCHFALRDKPMAAAPLREFDCDSIRANDILKLTT